MLAICTSVKSVSKSWFLGFEGHSTIRKRMSTQKSSAQARMAVVNGIVEEPIKQMPTPAGFSPVLGATFVRVKCAAS
jgi:hypothetical protein